MTEKDMPEDNSATPEIPDQFDATAFESLDLPAVPELPVEPKFAAYPYVAASVVVEKMQAFTKQRQEAAAERERLASMPKQPFRRDEPRIGRNDPCPCGSGQKYKKCHMGKELES